jgi:aminomethyltransferase
MADGGLRRTALHGAHKAHGAQLVPFAGFEMPVHYGSILREHEAVRKRAGLFDLSHMAQFEISGSDAAAWLDALTINHVATMKPFQARYNIFCNASGGAHDDVILYRLEGDDWLLVVNAANAAKMWALLERERSGNVRLVNRQRDARLALAGTEGLYAERALIAIQGPRSVEILAQVLPAADRERLSGLKYYTCARVEVAGVPALAARTGYTGEDGYELFIEGSAAPGVWNALLEAGKSAGLEPAGLGSRDMLRLEAGMPLYGFELSEELTPLQAGLSWVLKLDKPAFTGKAALAGQNAAGTFERIAGLQLEGRVPARHGYPVLRDGLRVGEITSATVAPSVGGACIATALVARDVSAVGTELGVEIRGKIHLAHVVPLPFYKRSA